MQENIFIAPFSSCGKFFMRNFNSKCIAQFLCNGWAFLSDYQV